MTEVKILLIGGPRDREMILAKPVPSLRFAAPMDLEVSFRGLEADTFREPREVYQYNIETIRGRKLIRYIGVHEDLDFDMAMAKILGSYAK